MIKNNGNRFIKSGSWGKKGPFLKIGKTNQIHTNILKEFKINSHQMTVHFSTIPNADFMIKGPGYQREITPFFDIILKNKN
jgi:hypothetical protein